MSTRLLPIEGCFNFRDLGGYPAAEGRTVRWGRVFRSDALHHLTPRGAEQARRELGLRTTIDLRTEKETGEYPDGLGLPNRHHLPFLAELRREPTEGEQEVVRVDRSAEATSQRYLTMLEDAGDRVAEALGILGQPDALPAVFYCAAGKDRTGVLAAVLLGVLGVPHDEIVRDYTLTSAGIESVIERLRSSPTYKPGIDGVPTQDFHPHADTMALVLEGLVAEHGSVTGYVRAHGVGTETIASLRDALLD